VEFFLVICMHMGIWWCNLCGLKLEKSVI